VGYVTYVNTTNTPGYELVCNPMDAGTNNTMKGLFPGAPSGTQILIWNASLGSYINATYSSLLGGHWKTNGVNADATIIAPGTGIFISIGGTGKYTNTFLGNVIPFTAVVNNRSIGTGLQLLSSSVPFGDYVTNGATIGITNVASGAQILLWSPATQSFSTYTWSALLGGHWKLNGVNSNPFLNVGQGFFYNSGSPYTWVQTGP
jgi:hypothetical protein